MVTPNAIKVLLPQGSKQTSAKPMVRIIIDSNLNYYSAFGKEDEMPISPDDIALFLADCAVKEPEMYVALYADETVPYREVVRVLNIANENNYKMVYVANCYRPLTATPEDALEVMREIEAACSLKFTDIVNNSNLGSETTADLVQDSFDYIDKLSALSGLPVWMHTVRADIAPQLHTSCRNIFPLHLQQKLFY